ncbi:MAG: sigma 54-interacting transcriptional regulator [Gammaproteobacteria bacterium]|nr:sigma 54-interacting transcriptional regulator [Gammaproteobacteria bacterium]MBU1507145.1 sigma 54-interacting transcriptional regulator [Gammaproteobacteria bacterium]MBU2121331.1 sigma 54-interacting transcriptional regulator [Gammaproteobacteria bacterium]MBU2201594.1 sigma 54-interacting transcriptional regulator [Gammaproteobacteria bacterium]MBU2276808.1 sigma 54-interacting transcriptional regulator [Gammaproteobacteria bacterium]
MPPTPPARAPTDWHAQELLLMREVMRLIGRSLAPGLVLREMLHLMSELLGLNRGRIVLVDDAPAAADEPRTASIQHAYGLTQAEVQRGRYAWGEGITGRVLATGQPAIVQDIDAEPVFLARGVERSQLPPETVAFIALPIEVNNAPIGVLACHRIRSRQRHLNDDLAVLRVLATLVGQLLQLEALVAEQTRQLEARNAVLANALNTKSARYGLIGSSPPLLQALSELERVSQTQATVLLLGQSGTGKELFARAVHLASGRRDRPFIKVNCSAIPDALFESELFGYEKGAFTGASTARAGWFEQADSGTIFLDEIGELPLAMQSKLLRTLQEGTLVRLGGQREVKVNVRLVAATHRDLAADVEAGRFRQDLYYRLHVIPIHLPSLAERREDIRALALHFVSRANQAHQRNVNLSPDALARLEEHPWPGNIRELGNVIERLVLLTNDTLVGRAELDRFLPAASVPLSSPSAPQPPAATAAAERPAIAPAPLVRDYAPAQSHSVVVLQTALAEHHGNQSRAAQSLGLTLRQFSYRLRKAGLK